MPSTASQNRLAGGGVRSRSPTAWPTANATERDDERGDRHRARRPARVASAQPDDQQVRRVADRGRDPEDDTRAAGPRRTRRRRSTPEIRTTPASTTGSGEQGRARRPLPEEQPREEADDDDLQVAEDRRQPRPDRLDGVVPEHQVAGEEDPGDRRQPDRAAAAAGRSVAAPRARRGRAAAARRRPGRTSRSRARPPRTGRRRPRTRCRSRRAAPRVVAAARTSRAARVRSSSPRSSSLRSCPACTPTKRRPSSSYCPGSGIDGASSIGSVPDWVFGKAMTSRMFVWRARSAAQRSMPRAIPPCGGAPYSNASRTAPNFSRIPSTRLALEQEERSSRSRRWIRIEPPPSSQPLSARSYWSARARPAGSVGRRLRRIAGCRHQQLLVLGQDAAERVVGRVPAAGLGVPLVHREAVDPDVGQHVRVGQAEPVAELDAQPAEDVGGHVRRVGDDQDQVALVGGRTAR